MPCTLPARFASCLSLCLVMLSSPLAMAQGGGGGEDTALFSITGGVYSSVFAVYTTLALIPVSTTAGVIATIIAVVREEEPTALKLYLNENQPAAVAMLHTAGGSEGVYDVALLFNVPAERVPAFAGILAAQRARLMPLIDGEVISAQDALAFASIVVEAMMAHDALRMDVEAALATAYALNSGD